MEKQISLLEQQVTGHVDGMSVRLCISFQGFRKKAPCLKSIKRYKKEVFDIDKLQQ